MGKARLKISSIDIMGILGLLIWIVTVFLRRYYPINTVIPIFQVMPNFWCAWFATDLLNQIVSPIYSEKKILNIEFSKKALSLICVIVILMALTNKVITIINTSKSIDVNDMLSTIVAEIIIFSIPVLQKEKIFK